MSEELYGKMTKTDLYNNSKISRLTAYLLFLSNEETDPSILPRPMNAEEEEVYKLCVLNGPASAAHGAAKADASNIGVNLGEENDNSEDWGDALGGGEIASGEKKLVTGGTVYTEVRPAADGTYAKTAQTTAQNLTALDTQVKTNTDAIDVRVEVQDNAGFHNSIFRGKYLGSELTAEQSANIQNGTFKDMFIGDYWTKQLSITYYKATADTEAVEGKTYYADAAGTTLDEQPTAGDDISNSNYYETASANGTFNFRIAGFDFFYNVGDNNFSSHHVLVVPDTILFSLQMHKTNTTEGGYMDSDVYKNMPNVVAALESAFGASHIPAHKVLLPTTCTGGKYTSWGWQERKADLMTEVMVHGCRPWGAPANNGYSVGSQDGQLPLFRLSPAHKHTRQNYWLQDVSSSAAFALVHNYGLAHTNSASTTNGVRPAFPLY